MSEWQTDQLGRRYRMIGNCKEYETMITVGGGITIPESQLAEYNSMKKETSKRPEEDKKEVCPFSAAIDKSCREDCALRVKVGCSIAFMVDRRPSCQTAGKRCPINSQNCRPDCALYKNGCVLTAI